MQELIKIEKRKVDDIAIDTIDARELHEFLDSGVHFSDWIKGKIAAFRFTQDTDFIVHEKMTQYNQVDTKEYYVTVDMAKELSMVERNEKGRQARRYFIECEKKLKEVKPALPGTYKDALIALVTEIDRKEKLEIELKVAKPKIEFHDELIESDGLYSIGEAAKLIGTGRTRLFIKLREMKVFFNTEPYQTFKERGYFEVKTTTKNSHVQTQAFVTPKGLEWLNKKLKADGDFQTSF